MGVKICPICDTKVNKMNFCPECKKFVAPKETSQNFYLNEKRPDDGYTNWGGTYFAHDANRDLTGCHDEFSGVGSEYDMNREYAGEKYRQQRMQNRSYGQYSGTYGKKASQINSQKVVEKLFGIAVGICAIIVCICIGFGLYDDFDFGFDENSDNTTIDYDADIPDYEDIVGNDYGNYINETTGDSALTDEQVEEDGDACTMYGHYDGISAVSFMDELAGCAEAYDLTLTFNKSLGYKNLYTYSTNDEEYTCYELCDVFATSGLGKDGIATYYDYNTGEMHGIYAWARVDEYTDGSAILSIFNCVIDALDDSNLSGDERENVIKYLDEYIAKTDFTFEADDAVQISVGDWNVYVGRTTTNIYVSLIVTY